MNDIDDEIEVGEANEFDDRTERSLPPIPATPPSTHKKKCTTQFQDSLLNVLRNPKPSASSEPMDPELPSFTSFIPCIQKFNDAQKMEL